MIQNTFFGCTKGKALYTDFMDKTHRITLSLLNEEIRVCINCNLSKTRINAVPGMLLFFLYILPFSVTIVIERLLRFSMTSVTITITCEICGVKQQLERQLSKPETVRLVCRGCEAILVADITQETLWQFQSSTPSD